MICNIELAVCKIKISAAMKLLLILPNLVLIAVSGVNLFNEITTGQPDKNLAVTVLHFSVLIMCLVFVSLIVKSMFRVVDAQDKAEASYYKQLEARLRHY
ncbi:MAG: hypothetical protein DI539_05315 [Flavobacterium psychrophilum]|nr:MAG: hypothetical protein DI539_05315 [Flavobacterium psychrophilum]